MEQELKLVITGDASEAIKSLQDVNKSLGSTKSYVEDMQEQLATFRKALKLATNPQDVENLTKGINALQSQLKQISRAGNPLKNAELGARQAEIAFGHFDTVMRSIPQGVNSIESAVEGLGESFLRLRTETGSSAKAFSLLGSELFGGGGLMLGLGVAIPLILELGKSLLETKSDAEKARDVLGDVFKDAAKDVSKEVAQLEIFRTKLNDTNLSASERVKIAQEYNGIADKQNQIDTTQINNLDLINKKIGEQNQLILQRAIATAATSKLGSFADKFVESQLKVNQALKESGLSEDVYIKKTEEFSKKRNDILNQIANAGTISGKSRSTLTKELDALDAQISASLGSQRFDILDAIKARNEAKKELDKANSALAGLITSDGLSKQSDGGSTKLKDKVDKDAKEALRRLEEYQKEREKIIAEFSKDFAAFRVFSLPDVGDPKDNNVLKDRLQKELDKVETEKFDLKIKVNPDIQAIDPKKVPLPLKPTVQWKDTDLHKQLEAIQNQLNDTFESFAKSIDTEALSSIGDAIGAALSGGNINDVFKQFEETLGSAVESLGKKIIELNVAALLVKKSLTLTFANPGVGIAAGIALTAIGSALKNLAGSGIKGFAKGGWVSGSGSGDTVPAMLTPGEFVVTKDKAPLAAMLFGDGFKGNVLPFHFATGGTVPTLKASSILPNKAQTVNVIVSGEISGDKILLNQSRTQRRQNLGF